ncbi:MAG: SDR family oxidoreductase [Rhodothermales bacterium]|nr:SDR family oxidoreductase [Rhodothermales bacterium]
MTKPLTGRVAVVAGATRGAGRGIACALGEAGATVYCTGRSIRGAPATPGRPETIDETAAMVAERGGVGIAVRVDHLDEEAVIALFEQVQAEQGRLDVLVNDVWGGDALTDWGTPFWQLDVQDGLQLLRQAVFSHVLTSRYGVPMMVAQGQGLVIEITDGDASTNRHYRGHLFYDLAKISAMRLAFGMAEELKPHGVAALALTPGFLRSEAMLDHFGVTEATWRDAVEKDPHFIASETPLYVGRAVAALAADPDVLEQTGQATSSWACARRYGFTDADGRRPDWGRYLEEHFPHLA